MSKAVPWSMKGMGFDMRRAAQEAARREGMSLSEWLGEAMSERAEQIGIEPEQLADEDGLEAIAERLRQLDERNRSSAARNIGRRDRPEERDAPRARRQRSDEEAYGSTARPLADIDPEDLLEQAVDLFHKRNAKSQKQTIDALASVARVMEATEKRREGERAALENLSRRLGEIETSLSRRGSDDGSDALKSALGRLETRLDAMARRSEPDTRKPASRATASPPEGERLDRLESKLNALLAAVAPPDHASHNRAELRATTSTRSLAEAIAQIGRRQRDLDSTQTGTVASASDPVPEPVFVPPSTASRPASQADILALANKIEEIRREVLERSAKAEPAFDLDKLHAEIARMSTGLHELATQGSVAALEASIRRLPQELDVSRNESAREALLRPLETLLADLRHRLAEIDPRTRIAGIETQIQGLTAKLEELRRLDLDPEAFRQVQRHTQEIRDLLQAAAERPGAVDKIEQQVAQLARRIERAQQIAVRPQDAALLQAAGGDLPPQVAERISSAALDKVEERLEGMASRIETLLRDSSGDHRYSMLEQHIEHVHRELSQRLSESLPSQQATRALEDMVRDLAEKFEAANKPQSDARALEALERQIGELATRLDRSSTGLASLPYLQQAIGDLFTKLEAAQQATIEAAETAARQAVQEGLTQRDPHAYSASVPEEVSREISELRDLQDAADRRTHSTLNAVHETLEKVVDRLAMLEEELAEVRPEARRMTLASGPAPNFGHDADSSALPPIPRVARDPEKPGKQRDEERRRSPAPNHGLDDFLIEPGRGFPARGGEAAAAKGKAKASDQRPGQVDAPATGRADFIAAARRAAQAAQKESAAAAVQMQAAASGESRAAPRRNLVEQARSFVIQHKRPVVLSVAALFLIVGAYAVVKTLNHAGSDDVSYGTPRQEPQHASQNHTAAENAPAGVTPVPTPAQTVPAPASKEPPQTMHPIPGSDPIVTGNISAKPQEPAAGPMTETTRDLTQTALQAQADLGNAKAQFELATRYAEGRGLPRDLKSAGQWYEKAAAQGLAPAQYRLGSLYEKGMGVNRDLTQAKDLYLKAAEQGNIRAMHNLAVLLAEVGENGKPDYAGAAQWFRKAAEYGVRDSQYNYAILLARGLGVTQNLASSYTWFAIAAQQGDEDAAKKRDDVGARLSATDLATAKAVAAGFHAKSVDPVANDVQWPVSTTQLPFGKPQRPKVSSL